MERFYHNIQSATNDKPEDVFTAVNISFTGDAIQYLSTSDKVINLDEWEWHEEIINGEKYCIVTDHFVPLQAGKLVE